MSCCDEVVEPCNGGECSGFDEVIALLPNGNIWDADRGGVYSQYVQALGAIKTELNQIICQEYNELDPCKSVRLFDYWAYFYKFPSCVEQTQTKLCEWIDLLHGDCPIGSKGFIKKAIDFVLPDVDIAVDFNLSTTWKVDSLCADDNAIVITVPVANFKYYKYKGDYPHQMPDGSNCRKYFIPEIECLRKCVFPLGASVGYKTTETGDYDINDAADVEESERPKLYDNYCEC